MRQWYATHAMIGILSNPNIAPLTHFPDVDGSTIDITEVAARWAFQYADAMLEEEDDESV